MWVTESNFGLWVEKCLDPLLFWRMIEVRPNLPPRLIGQGDQPVTDVGLVGQKATAPIREFIDRELGRVSQLWHHVQTCFPEPQFDESAQVAIFAFTAVGRWPWARLMNKVGATGVAIGETEVATAMVLELKERARLQELQSMQVPFE